MESEKKIVFYRRKINETIENIQDINIVVYLYYFIREIAKVGK